MVCFLPPNVTVPLEQLYEERYDLLVRDYRLK